MATLGGQFSIYEPAGPGGTTIWCAPTFRAEVGALFRGMSPADRKSLANANVLIQRLANGEQLSNESFRTEDVGFAFAAGRLRIYGGHSTKHRGCFVMSHAIVKLHEKLADIDKKRMGDCLAAFDSIPNLQDL